MQVQSCVNLFCGDGGSEKNYKIFFFKFQLDSQIFTCISVSARDTLQHRCERSDEKQETQLSDAHDDQREEIEGSEDVADERTILGGLLCLLLDDF